MKHSGFKKSALFAFLFFFVGFYGPAQDFVWKKGTSIVSIAGTYGTLGTPAAPNTPGGRQYANSWQDNAGNFWLFGGYGHDAAGLLGFLSDLWKYNVATGQWTWMSGVNTTNQIGVYGTQGTFAPANRPGARWGSVSWMDASGNLWLLGGTGYDAIGSLGELNDLWLYDVASGQWKWVKGSNSCYQLGTYGTQGTPAGANVPGARYSAVSWTDALGNLWLFGGYGYGSAPGTGNLNDLWKYNISTNQWTWIKGGNITNQYGTYGTQGTPAPANLPGSRFSPGGWVDLSGDLWLIGGNGYATSGAADILSDMWRYHIATNEWTWMKGYNTMATQLGTYGTMGVPAPGNLPGARHSVVTWTDGLGDLWLYSGYGSAASGIPDQLNDLWRYKISNNQWTWVRGSNITDQSGVYGVQNLPAPTNMPGSRSGAMGWKDGSNNLWLFGGVGYDGTGGVGKLHDLWKYFSCIGPTVTISSANGTLCAGESATMTANGALTYTWAISTLTTQSWVVAPLGNNSYTVYGTDMNECNDTAYYSVTVLSLPTITTSVSNTMICAGETTSLIVTGAATYSWSTGETNATATITPVQTGTYTVIGTGTNGCSSQVAAITQSVAACLGINGQNAAANEISIYPNPSHGEFTIQLNRYGTGKLVILNALGQIVFEQTLASEQQVIKPDLARGLYQYQLLNDAKVIGSGKLIFD